MQVASIGAVLDQLFPLRIPVPDAVTESSLQCYASGGGLTFKRGLLFYDGSLS
jgi:hypothetical protein